MRIQEEIVLVLMLTTVAIECFRSRRAAVGPVWPTNKIPYMFSNRMDFDLDARGKVEHILLLTQNMLAVEGQMCIEFVPREDQTDYILFFDNGDCSSAVGYTKGINRISLSRNCISTEIVMHEIMHKLGFDHEHSRQDRDKHITVNFDNINSSKNRKNDYNFEINSRLKNNQQQFESSPYDFFSITHYNSDAMQVDKTAPTILSKIPALVSKDNQIEIERRYLSNIDIIQVQTMYNCKKIKTPAIVALATNEDMDHRLKQSNRFQIEAAFLGLDDNLIKKYLNKTYETCGMNHFWPIDYPLVESNHKHYQLNCIEKKPTYGRCFFSLECISDNAVCNRPFFKRRGWCITMGFDDLDKLNQKINDGFLEAGKIVKDNWKKINNPDKFKEELNNVGNTLIDAGIKIKDKWDKLNVKKFQNDLVDTTIEVKDKVVEVSKNIKDSILNIFG